MSSPINSIVRRVTALILAFSTLCFASDTGKTPSPEWTTEFYLVDCRFSSAGHNRFFVLEPGFTLSFAGLEDGDSANLVITVLADTKVINGVETRVIEEREVVAGELVEVSRNYFAFCENTSSVFYFGEDVDIYENGRIKDHAGSWIAGEHGNSAGLMMPGLALMGAAYYQEVAPGTAMDRARVLATDSTLVTPAGRFDHCLVIEETSPLEPKSREYKVYAPGIGLVKDGQLLLVRYSKTK